MRSGDKSIPDYGVGAHRTGNVLEILLAQIGKLGRDLAATLGEERVRQLRADGDSLGTDAAVATALDVILRIPLP